MTPEAILKQYWGYDQFRPLQKDIINHILAQKDTVALLPTGGGKSICFQVPALGLKGICIVITPLIALMNDQVHHLTQKGIPAALINASMSSKTIERILNNCVNEQYKFLYIAPERLKSEDFLAKLQEMTISFIAIDEAHCIAQWGYDFRPSYLKIGLLKELLPHIPFLALTATATPDVLQDIIVQLHLSSEHRVFKSSFARTNLSYFLLFEEDKLGRLLKIITYYKNQLGLIYTRNRKNTKTLAAYLQQKGLKAGFYHAGLSHKERDQIQKQWLNDQFDVLVCTNAFGMGIDKGNVRYVIHWDIPDCLENYFQEVGRAGRDGLPAHGILLMDHLDVQKFEEESQKQLPEQEFIRRVYKALANFLAIPIGSGALQSYNFEVLQFTKTFELPLLPTIKALEYLEQIELLTFLKDLYSPSRLHIITTKEELYHLQVKSKQWDAFLKTLLRTYTGLFNDFVRISEQKLAQNAMLPEHEVRSKLVYLDQNDYISYVPESDGTQVLFLEPRLSDQHLDLKPNYYNKRKEWLQKKAHFMRQFYSQHEVCRSRFVLNYFGETTADCGTCDVCLERHSKSKQLEAIKTKLLELKTETLDLTFETCIKHLETYPYQWVYEVYKFLKEDGQI